MKKKSLLIALLLLCSAAVITVLAAGGSSSDPLISLSYLNGTYTDKVNAAVDSRLDASDQAITAAVTSGGSAGGSTASGWTETRLKQQDVLSGSTGLTVMTLAGSVKVTFSSGAVVDVTNGTTVPSGTALAVRHRYLVAENTTASFTVTSLTAVVDHQGPCTTALSASADYNAMAAALKTMHLFKGTFTGYGSGYDLEVSPTRLQALIMFIRVLGEEDQALAYTGTNPFRDIAAGSEAARYVGYAYAKGYTAGYTATSFKPSQAVNAYQYTEFVLRALGYSSNSNTNLSGTLEKARTSGVLTAGEVSALKSGTFLRAQLVYISFYALDAVVSGSGNTLRNTLISKGVFTSAESETAAQLVSSSRIA